MKGLYSITNIPTDSITYLRMTILYVAYLYVHLYIII